jgi:hypothetical protein
MHFLDWIVVIVFIIWMVSDGLRRSNATDKVEGYFLANRTQRACGSSSSISGCRSR